MTLHLPPGPRFSAAHMLDFARSPEESHRRLAERYGDPFTVPLVGRRIVVTGRPELVKAVFSAPPEALGVIDIESPLVGPNSIVRLEGEAHRRARKLLAPLMGDPLRHGGGERMMLAARRHSAALATGRPVKLTELGRRISLEVMLRTVFGFVDEGELAAFTEAFSAFCSTGSFLLLFVRALQIDLGPLSPWGRVLARRRVIDGLIGRRLDAARANPEADGDLLAEVFRQGDSADPLLSTEAVRDQLHTMLHAGHASTAEAIGWALHWAAFAPGEADRLRAELAPLGDEPSARAVLDLPRLDAFVREVLRIHPIAPMMGRVLRAPLRLGDWDLPAGTAVAASAVLTHRAPGVWGDPAAFRPERHLERSRDAGEFYPFGGGHRRCAGAALAQAEMKLALAAVLPRFHIRSLAGRPLRSVMGQGICGPEGGAKAVITPLS